MYIRIQNYDADMKLNVVDDRTDEHLVTYSMVKNDRFGLHFCFPGDAPATTAPIFPIDEKTIQCLPNILQHVPIYLEYFLSYTMLK